MLTSPTLRFMEPFDNPLNQSPEFSVGELSRALKKTVETNFQRVRVKGEISGLKRHTSGHVYFALKDTDALIDGVCWRGQYAQQTFHPADGMEVICTGRITTYPARSKYQIVVDSFEVAGEGALLKLLEQRKKTLAAEGLFAEERKQPLPFLPRVIGVITSPTGAVIRDIIHRIEDRFPTHILLWPVLVQGEGAAAQIAAAIKGFDSLKPDLLIVARGGGSLEDLWAFNEEVVVRAAANTSIPLISAVGHETDTTLIDYVADRRAPTPTAAAEMAVPVRADLLAHTCDRERRLVSAINRFIDNKDTNLVACARGLPKLERLADEYSQRLDDWHERLANAVERLLAERTQALKTRQLLLKSYSYRSTLKRGFSIVKDQNNNAITRKANTKKDMPIEVIFYDGKAKAKILAT